ncbi:MAG: hypothetical protein HOO67_04395 [Candidatus Peribacteraceae bacterium]|nr:hypothetical protein [Candidatus Peribacteraceae bacterium]
MNRSCIQCRQPFQTTQRDLEFFDLISPVIAGKKYLIPPPTLCPDCRVQRRMAWRNDRTFYHRTCDLTGAKFVSMYPPDAKFPVYKQDAWHGDGWDGLTFGRDIDFTRPFFDQWAALNDAVPHWGVAISTCENSDYCNYCNDEKNCYLDIAAESNEDCYYDHFTKYSKNCVDSSFVYHSTLCYECIQCYNCYGVRWSQYMDDCSDCAFCFDCKGSRNCLLSINLRNKEYYILNEPHTKEEYEKKLQELKLKSFSALQQVFALWKKMRIQKGLYRDMYNLNCENCIGNDLKNSKNCEGSFNAVNCEDCKYLYDVLDAKNCCDMNYSPYGPEGCYEVISTVGLKNSAFYMAGPYNSSCYYSHMCKSCKDCFGCVGLKQKQYCILNKQFTKEEYETLVPKIIEHMTTPLRSSDGSFAGQEWGEFFPVRLSSHGYNETVAQEYMPLTKAQVLERGWPWRDEIESEQSYLGPEATIPDTIDDANEDICKKILSCSVTGKPFKIIPQELKFYKQLGIPLPRKSPAQRHKERNELRSPRTLWQRTCSQCSKPVTTSYAPDRPEKIVCEACYLKAVY